MDVIRLLLKKGAAVTEKDKSLMSCLHWAVMSSNVRRHYVCMYVC